MKVFYSFIILLFSSQGNAASDWQYGHFGDRERLELNGPHLITSEYQSDRLTYQYLQSWNSRWNNQKNQFQYTAGSLGPTRFYTYGRGRFRTSVTENIDMRLTYFEMGTLARGREALIFEFVFKLYNFWHISIYGEPDTQKQEDDIGLSSEFIFGSHSLKAFHTWVDFSHNKRQEDFSQYEKEPGSFGLIWNWQREDESGTQFLFRHDKATRQVFQSGRIYQFQGTEMKFEDRSAIDGENYLSSQLIYRQGHEGDSDNQITPQTYFENRQADVMVQVANEFSRFNLYGIRYVYSEWASDSGNVIHNDWLPHFWIRAARYRDGKNQYNFDLGYEMTWHRSRGPNALRSQQDGNDRSEQRFNFRYNYKFAEKVHFNLLLTFDLDEMGTGETWEGGAMQFSTLF